MKPYIIGETAYHHEGQLSYLKKMVADIADMGLDAVKFHLLLNPESYMDVKHPLFYATQQFVFSREEWNGLISYAHALDLDVVALCDDIDSIDFIIEEHPGIKGIELHSTSLNDYFLLQRAADFSGTVILGIGGSDLDEIGYAVGMLRKLNKNDILLMYGFQAYPTDYADINLSKMLKIRDMFDLPIGYADHTGFDDENNVYISSLAAALGIAILEKHYTPDPGIPRIDYQAAVGKEILCKIKKLMGIYLEAFGSGNLNLSVPERKYGNTGPMKKALVARQKIKAGDKLTLENLWFKRTEQETPVKQKELLRLVGLTAARDIEANELIDYSQVNYAFRIPDYKELSGGLTERHENRISDNRPSQVNTSASENPKRFGRENGD